MAVADRTDPLKRIRFGADGIAFPIDEVLPENQDDALPVAPDFQNN